MSIDNPETLGGHPTPDRQDEPPGRYVKLDPESLAALVEHHELGRGSARLLERLVQALSREGWQYEPRTVPARSRRELWEVLDHNGPRYLAPLVDAGLVAEHRHIGFEVLCWAEVVADTARELSDRRKRAVRDLRYGDRRVVEYVAAVYGASPLHDLPRSPAATVRENAINVRENAINVRGRPAKTSPVELQSNKPPLPPHDSQVVDSEAEGGDSEQNPRTAEVVDLDAAQGRRSEKRWRADALAELAYREAERDALAGTEIRSLEGYCHPIRKRLADDSEVLDNLDRYRRDNPGSSPAEVAALVDADRPAVNVELTKRARPAAEDQSAAGWEKRVAQGIYAEQLRDLDLAVGGAP